MLKRRYFTALILAASCTGTDVGNGVIDIDVDVHGEIPEPPTAFAPAAGSASVNEAWVSVDRIRLRDAVTCDDQTELDLRGPFAIDARASGAITALSDIEVASTDYCRFELRWSPYKGPVTGVPDELPGASFLIKGTRADGISFILRSERGNELRLDARSDMGFSINDATHALWVGFDLANLFKGISLDTAIVDNDGIIRIEKDSNRALLDVFDDNIDRVAKLFDDNDGNGELDPNERSDNETLAE